MEMSVKTLNPKFTLSGLASATEGMSKPNLTKELKKKLHRNVVLGLLMSFHNFEKERGLDDKTALESCLNIMSAMVEDGTCSSTDITTFRKMAEGKIGERLLCLTSGEQMPKSDALEASVVMDTVSGSTEGISTDEALLIARHSAAAKEFASATRALANYLSSTISDECKGILSTYRGFDKEFVKLWQ